MKQRMLTLMAALALPISIFAQAGQGSGMIGGMSRAEFDRINAEGAAKVAAIQANSTPLSESDKKLMMQVAQGGMMQLQVSQAALPKTSRDDAKTLAQSEVDEQTGLSQKLMEIARAKGMTLPSEPAAGTAAILKQIGMRNGADLDAYYVRTSGVEGHKKLQSTMTIVSRTAKDPALKAIAAAALPLIRTHLKVSQQISGGMGGKMSGAGKK
jgi:putative membrane protein